MNISRITPDGRRFRSEQWEPNAVERAYFRIADLEQLIFEILRHGGHDRRTESDLRRAMRETRVLALNVLALNTHPDRQ
jgi:hypothetical protein